MQKSEIYTNLKNNICMNLIAKHIIPLIFESFREVPEILFYKLAHVLINLKLSI